MRVISESIVSEMKPTKDSSSTALCVVEGPCMEFGKVNRNNRIYSRKLIEDKIVNNPAVKEALRTRSMLGEGGHPENRVDISYPEVALAVEKLWIPEGSGNLLWGRFAILDTPVGKILNTLVRYGTKLGISARAMADSVQQDGHEVISENSYELITFDAVPEPGFKCARLEKVESVSKPVREMTVKELKESSSALKSFNNPIFESRIRNLDSEILKREKLDTLTDSLKPILKEIKYTLKELHNESYKNNKTDLISIIKEAKGLICKYKTDRKLVNENYKKYKTTNISINKTNHSLNDLAKFTNESYNETDLNIKNIFENSSCKDEKLERMCKAFRRK